MPCANQIGIGIRRAGEQLLFIDQLSRIQGTVVTDAFSYPPSIKPRRHGPRGYSSYRQFRPWLRDEFAFRCVYCLMREQWGLVTGYFDLDHFEAQCERPVRSLDYDNILYSCRACNVTKGAQTVPSPIELLVASKIIVHDDGAIEGCNEQSKRLIRLLDLDSPEYRAWRRTWTRIIELAERYDRDLYEQLLGFPNDLPNLSLLRPPGGNTRPGGVRMSYFALRERGELPGIY